MPKNPTLPNGRCHMKLYAGIDLHANNNYLGIVEEENNITASLPFFDQGDFHAPISLLIFR